MLLTWANLLTLIRFACIAPCALCIANRYWGWAAAFFTLAVVTDLLDGKLARHCGVESPLGGLFDHATDALFVSAALAALAWIALVPWLLSVLVLFAFLQYTLDSRALAGRHLRTSWLGRNNGIAYFVVVGIPTVREALGLGWPDNLLVSALAWLLVGSTVVSMADRARAWIAAE